MIAVRLKKLDDLLQDVLLVDDADVDDETKYHLVFKQFNDAVHPLMKELGLRLPDWYYDPDTSYREDTAAIVRALGDVHKRVAALLLAYREAEP